MFKWIIAILIAVSIFSSPIQQSTNTNFNNGTPDITSSMACINFAKGATKNILITANNVLEVIIRNIDRSTTTVVPRSKKIDTQSL